VSTLIVCAQSTKPVPFPSPRTHTGKIDDKPPSLVPIQTLWTLPLNNQLTVAPAYEKLRAFFAIAGDRIVAYDLLTGKQLWLVSAQPQMDLVAGDGLLFLVEPDSLTALRTDDGSVAWQLPLAEPLAVHPVWDIGWLIVAAKSGSISALRAADGSTIWSRDLGSPAHALPALAADRVYIPKQDARIVALRVDTGAPVWERKLGGPPDEILALPDRLYVGSADNYFYSIAAKDGRVDWRWRTGGDVIGLPLADEHRVYFVALDNVVRALGRSSGVQLWMKTLPLRPMTGPVRAGGTIVVTGFAPTLRAVNVSDGAAAGEIPAAPEVAAVPYVFDDPVTKVPKLLFVVRDIAAGATANLVTRSFEPTLAPVAPLPNIVTFGSPTTTPLPR
jgi:outer membrane protein assembly factor BamB